MGIKIKRPKKAAQNLKESKKMDIIIMVTEKCGLKI